MRVGIAIGSNVGDRLGNLQTARDRIRQLHEGDDAEFLQSSVYETEPVDCEPGTPAFLNAVLEIDSSLEPAALLARTQQIEADLGRPAEREKNSPRTIDVDLLYAGDLKIDTPELQLPHPRMTERRFVLEPLAEIVSGIKTLTELLAVSDLIEKLPEDSEVLSVSHETW